MEYVSIPHHFFLTSLKLTGVDLNLLSYTVFFGCCLAGAALTCLLPEVKGRDPDVIDAEEIREAREARRLN